jgi:hypothetical protein
VADRRVIDAIIREGRRRKSPKKTKAALATGIVESGLENVGHGDRDSVNWRQERASIYGGDMSITRSVKRFFDEAEQFDRPGMSAGELAARVQRPAAQYRGRYGDVSGQAQKLLDKHFKGVKTRKDAARALQRFGAETINTSLTTQRFDQEGFQKAQRGALLAQHIAKRNPRSRILTMGLLSDQAPSPQDFITSSTRKISSTVPGITVRSPSSRGSGSPSSRGRAKGTLRESFYNGPGGINVDDGKKVAKGYVSGHTDHVHAAADNDEDRIWLEVQAKKRGLTVTSEGGGKHAAGSFHYQRTKKGRSKGIDVSGDPAAMAAYSRDVARYFGISGGRRRRR